MSVFGDININVIMTSVLQQDVKSAHEKLRRQLSPASRQRVEEEKYVIFHKDLSQDMTKPTV